MRRMALSAVTVLLSVVLARHLVSGFTCKDGYFLNENRDCIPCPEHCLFCDSVRNCLYCEKGFWGQVCELPCSICMAGTKCDKVSGFCKDGCAYGYSGLLCNIKCDIKCISCTREQSKNCLQCAPGRYPSVSCSKICSGCHEHNCDEAGVCALRCVNGSWGQRCERKCPQHCKYESCDRDNGTCSFGCNDDTPGLQCNGTIFLDSNIDDIKSTPVIPIVVPVVVIVLSVGVGIGIWLKCRRRNHPDAHPAVAEEEGLVSGQADHVNVGKSGKKDEFEHLRIFLQEEKANRVLQETGLTLYECLSKCVGSLISLADSNVSTTKMERFVSAEILQKNVVTLLESHASSWKTMLPLLVDNFPQPEHTPNERQRVEYLKHLKEFYTQLVSECSKCNQDQNYRKLCLYALATCINTSIYVISADLQWRYFEPLFTFDNQPERILPYITVCLSPEDLFYEVKSTDHNAPPPKATGVVGLYMKLLEDTNTLCINVPEELRRIPTASKTALCNSVGKEVIEECCDILLKTKLINKRDYSKLTSQRDRQNKFCKKIMASEDAFDIFCKVLIKRRDTSILSPYIQNMSSFVKSCEYLSQLEALNVLDKAIVERNESVKRYLDACSGGEKELSERRKKVTTIVIASSSVGIASGVLVITGLALAPFSFGASLGVSIAGAAMGIGTGVASGAARAVDAKKEYVQLKVIEEVKNTMHEKESEVSSEMEKVEKLFKKTLNKCHGSQSIAPEISEGLVLVLGAAARTTHSIALIAIATGRLGSLAAAVSASVFGPLSLAFDIAFLAEAAHNKRKGDKTRAGDMLQGIREIVEIKCKIFNNMLRGDFENRKRMVEPD